MEQPKITICLTSCGRYDLLGRTLSSFFAYNTYPYANIAEFIISEDNDFDGEIMEKIVNMFRGYAPEDLFLRVMFGKVGQIASVDRMYEQVETPYIFHTEEDWETYNSSFIEKSLEIMESHPEILQVHLREQNDLNGHPVIYDNEQYDILEHGVGRWHGFSLNPSLRRLSDYLLINGGYAAVGHEVDLSEWYHERGFIAAILKEGYVKHIGQNRHVKDMTRL
jgi:hypothetical protein